MLGRFLILIAMMLLGPLFIEVYLYHPMVALEHDTVAIVPLIASPLGAVRRLPAAGRGQQAHDRDLRVACAVAIVVGVTGTAIHIAMHAPTLSSLVDRPERLARRAADPGAAVVCRRRLSWACGLGSAGTTGRPVAAIARILYGLAALCGLAGASWAPESRRHRGAVRGDFRARFRLVRVCGRNSCRCLRHVARPNGVTRKKRAKIFCTLGWLARQYGWHPALLVFPANTEFYRQGRAKSAGR